MVIHVYIIYIGDIGCTFEVRKCLHFQHPAGPGNLSPARRGLRPRSRGGAAPSPSFKNRRPVQAGSILKGKIMENHGTSTSSP